MKKDKNVNKESVIQLGIKRRCSRSWKQSKTKDYK